MSQGIVTAGDLKPRIDIPGRGIKPTGSLPPDVEFGRTRLRLDGPSRNARPGNWRSKGSGRPRFEPKAWTIPIGRRADALFKFASRFSCLSEGSKSKNEGRQLQELKKIKKLVIATAFVSAFLVFVPIIHTDVVLPSNPSFPGLTCLSGVGSITYYFFGIGTVTWVPNDYVSQGYAFQTMKCVQMGK